MWTRPTRARPHCATISWCTRVAFVHALRCHLRRQNPFPELAGLLGQARADDLRGYANIPNALTLRLGQQLQQARDWAMLDSLRWSSLDANLTTLANIQGACERIKNTRCRGSSPRCRARW